MMLPQVIQTVCRRGFRKQLDTYSRFISFLSRGCVAQCPFLSSHVHSGHRCQVCLPRCLPICMADVMSISKLDYITNKRVRDVLFCHLGENMICLFCRYDLASREWLALNRSVNNVVVRYGHSLALYKVKCLHSVLCQKLTSSTVTFIILCD